MKKIIISFIVLLSLCACDKIIINNNLVFEINSDVFNYNLVDESEYYTLVNPNKKVDTSVLGENEIVIEYKDKNNRSDYKTIKIRIIDTTPPIIDCKDTLTVTKGKTINVYDLINVNDNSNEKIKYEVVGKYNLNKIGEYQLKVLAMDSSSNIASKNVTLVVKDITVKTTGYYVYKPKSFWEGIKFKKDSKVEEDLVLCPNRSCGLYSEYGTYTIKDRVITIVLTSYKDESGKGKINRTEQCTIKSENKIVCDGKTYKWSKKLY